MKSGRGDRIRTYDLRYPKPPRYQAAPRPDPFVIRIKYGFDKSDISVGAIFNYFVSVASRLHLQIPLLYLTGDFILILI